MSYSFDPEQLKNPKEPTEFKWDWQLDHPLHHLPYPEDPTPYTPRDRYLGHPNIRRANSQPTQWTAEMIEEYKKCAESVEYFCTRYYQIISLDHGQVKISPFPYQREFWKVVESNRFVIALQSRQSAKTTSIVGWLLHHALFSKTAKRIALVAHKLDQAREIMERFQIALEALPFFLQLGVKTYNKGRIVFENETTVFAAATSSGSLRGKSVNVVYLDEFAFIHNDRAFMKATWPVISSGKTTKILITSTANGAKGAFYNIWQGAVLGVNGFVPFRVDWWDVPGRDAKWKAEQIAQTSQEDFDQEFCLWGNSTLKIRSQGKEIDTSIGGLYETFARAARGLPLDSPHGREAVRGDHVASAVEHAHVLSPKGHRAVHGARVLYETASSNREQGRSSVSRSAIRRALQHLFQRSQQDNSWVWSLEYEQIHNARVQVLGGIARANEQEAARVGEDTGRSRGHEESGRRGAEVLAHESEVGGEAQGDVQEATDAAPENTERAQRTLGGRSHGIVRKASERRNSMPEERKDQVVHRGALEDVRAEIRVHCPSNEDSIAFAPSGGDVEILTPSGWMKFDGVLKRTASEYRRIVLDDGTVICSSVNHPYVSFGARVIVEDEIVNEPIELYDPVNVRGGHVYIHDGEITSHNCNVFHGTSNTLINGNVLFNMTPRPPVWTGDDGVEVFDKPVDGHSYVMTVDVCKGRGKDRSTFTVWDVTDGRLEQVATYQNSTISPIIYPDLLYKWAKIYNRALVVIESNDEGASVARSLYYDLDYEEVFVENLSKAHGIGVFVDKKVKRIGCSNMKDLIESGKMIVRDKRTIEELLTFVPTRTGYEAEPGYYDDLVQNLWLMSWYVDTDVFKAHAGTGNLRERLRAEREKAIEESVPFVGLFPGMSDPIEDLIAKGYMPPTLDGWDFMMNVKKEEEEEVEAPWDPPFLGPDD